MTEFRGLPLGIKKRPDLKSRVLDLIFRESLLLSLLLYILLYFSGKFLFFELLIDLS